MFKQPVAVIAVVTAASVYQIGCTSIHEFKKQKMSRTESTTPLDAKIEACKLIQSGDEDKFRNNIIVRSPLGFTDGQVKWLFAGRRLRILMKSQGLLKTQRTIVGGSSEEEIFGAPAAYSDFSLEQEINQLLAMKGSNLSASPENDRTLGVQSYVKTCGSYQLAIDDPVPASGGEPTRENIIKYGDEGRTMAKILDDVSRKVKSGIIRDINSANDLIRHASRHIKS